jgi:hypothetical protein
VINDNIATSTFGSLAHPGSSDFNGIANLAYNAIADSAICATAVESGPATSTNTTYSNPGSSMSYLNYYQTLLARGYHLGPTIDHDNHNTTFGRTTYSRTAVIAPALNRTEIMKAFRAMHFYATQDCDTRVDFTINTKIMGSIFTGQFAPIINVNLTDGTTSTANAIIRVMFGVPGSGNIATQIYSSVGSSLNYSDITLSNNANGYYYIDITNGGSRIITAPIWYTRVDGIVLPVKLNSFEVKMADKNVLLSWTTAQEFNSSHFIIERSADGSIWNSITTVKAAGNSNTPVAYTAYDINPLPGVNYYRIKQVDNNGNYEYSFIKWIIHNGRYQLVIAPNPAHDLIKITFSKKTTGQVIIQLINIEGKLFYEGKTTIPSIKIDAARFPKGIYFIKMIAEDEVITEKVLLQ